MLESKVRPDGPKVRELRRVKKWTQEQLAEKACCSKRTVENIEAGKNVTETILSDIAEALDEAIDSLRLSDDRFPPSRNGHHPQNPAFLAGSAPTDSGQEQSAGSGSPPDDFLSSPGTDSILENNYNAGHDDCIKFGLTNRTKYDLLLRSVTLHFTCGEYLHLHVEKLPEDSWGRISVPALCGGFWVVKTAALLAHHRHLGKPLVPTHLEACFDAESGSQRAIGVKQEMTIACRDATARMISSRLEE